MSLVIHRGGRRALLALCLGLFAVLLAHPPQALAGQIVYSTGTGIWAMNDDGSGKRQLVSVSQVPGTEFIGDPSVQPNGNEVAFVGRWDQSSAEQNKYVYGAPGFCGGNCEGYYELLGGAVTRISPAPFDCGAQPCASWEFDPSVGSDGSVGYVFQEYVSEANGYGWSPILGQSALLSRDGAGSNQQQWKTQCEGTSSGNAEITDASMLAVDPVNPNEIVYANCQETGTDSSCPFTYVTGYDVYLSGANRGDPSDDTKVRTVSDPTANCFQDARTAIVSLGFSPDGSTIVEVHGGSGAGVYTYPASANATATERLAITGNWHVYSARYIGGNRIGVVAGQDSGNGVDHIDLYAISAGCTAATCSLASGQGVTNLTGTGNLGSDYILNTGNFGYTTSNVPLVAVSSAGGSGGTGGSGGNGGTGGNGGKGAGGGAGGAGKAPRATVSVARIQRLRVLYKKGLTFTVSCAAACHTRAALILDGRTALKLHLEKVRGHAKPKIVVLGTITKSFAKAGKRTLTIHISRAMLSKIGRARTVTLTLKLVVSGRSGASRTLTATIRVRR